MSNGETHKERPGPDAERSESGEDRRRKRKRRSSMRPRRGAGSQAQGAAADASRPEPGKDGAARRKRRRRRREGEPEPAGADARGAVEARAPGSAADESAPVPRARAEGQAEDESGKRGRKRRRQRRRGPRREEDGVAEQRTGDDDGSDLAEPGAARPERAARQDDEADDSEGDEDAPGRASFAPGPRYETDDASDDGAERQADAAGDDEPGEPIVFDVAALDASEDILEDEAPTDDPDPVTFGMDRAHVDERSSLPVGVQNVVGVKFGPAGRIYLYDAGEAHYGRGEEVVVESDRGLRIGVVAVDTMRQVPAQRAQKRVLRRPSAGDRRALDRTEERSADALRTARQVARDLSLPIKIFRAEQTHSGKKVRIYFTSEDRIDFRELVRQLTSALKSRIEMRQTGVRDEAKMVGGIGSCGRELCCTTWLPEFVPVSIKMAKDQGLVLNPTKVSGQCGRLKCCLVYEQSTYAELRKGLPKLGKRVVTSAGEGRVVEVDVLRQRVRVSLGPGEFQVFPGSEVKAMFPSQAPKKPRP